VHQRYNALVNGEYFLLDMGLRMVLRDRLGQYPVGLNVNKKRGVTVLEARVSASHQRACPTNSTSLEPA
jgi:hypothetical protein